MLYIRGFKIPPSRHIRLLKRADVVPVVSASVTFSRVNRRWASRRIRLPFYVAHYIQCQSGSVVLRHLREGDCDSLLAKDLQMLTLEEGSKYLYPQFPGTGLPLSELLRYGQQKLPAVN